MSKTARIALVNPPPLKGVFHHHPYLPIGLAYLAAVLESNGHEVTVFDCPASEIDHQKLKGKLAAFNPNVIGITSMTPMVQSTLLSAQISKEVCPNSTVVLGGPHATFMDKEVLNQEAAVDVVVRGEGEQTFLELSQQIVNSGSLNEVAGITFRNNEQIVQMPDRPYIQNLDQLRQVVEPTRALFVYVLQRLTDSGQRRQPQEAGHSG